MLIARLDWPVRLARWRAAREYGALLSATEHSKQALNIYLDWLASRQLESEIVSGLAVLLCTADDGLPSFRAVAGYISRPSVLADMMLQFVYGKGKVKGGWEKAHSGEAPPSFAADKFFLDHKSAHVPPILSTTLEELEQKTALPFMRQWGFEWRTLMEATKSPHSEYPYYFVDSLLQRSGVNGQFSQRQCDVYRSAFLRTLACAVSVWGMPATKAARLCLDSLPLNRGLANIDPAVRPAWLADIPERCCETDSVLEPLIRQLTRPGLGRGNMRPVALRLPISADLYEFADLSVSAILATSDFIPDLDKEDTRMSRVLPWELADHISFEGPLGNEEIAACTSGGISGACAPLCLDVWPLPSGFWHNDYFQAGVPLPAPYALQHPAIVNCLKDHVEITGGASPSATWCVWHDRWTPLYAKNGSTRCGMLTELREDEIAAARERHGMKLGWFAELNIWKRKSEYGDFELTRRREFFAD